MKIYITLGLFLITWFVQQSETTDPDGSLEANSTYIGIQGKRLELKWTYTGTKMYKSVSIFVPEDGPRSGNLKLWNLMYFAHNRTFSTKKYHVPTSVFNNLTEFRRETNSVFILVIKSVPSNLSSFQFLCRLKVGSTWSVPKDKRITVRVAVRPSITIPINKDEIDVPKGRDVKLRCKVTQGYPTPTIEWKKDSTRLSSKLISSTEADLELKNVQPVDAGRYVCTAKNIAGTQSKDVVITVKYIEIKPNYSSIIKAAFGSLVDLSCPIDGYPLVMRTWFKGNNQLSQSRGHQIKVAQQKDLGNYTCIGENGFGSRTVTFTVVAGPSKLKGDFRGNANWNKSNFILLLLSVIIFIVHFNE